MGTEYVKREDTTIGQVSLGVLQGRQLIFRSVHVLHGSEWNYYQGELIAQIMGAKISLYDSCPPSYACRLFAELGAQDLQHGMRSIHSRYINALSSQWQGNSPSAATEFEDWSTILIG